MESSSAAASSFPDGVPEGVLVDVLEHLDWVRELAVRLVGDPAEADDLRQEVFLLAQRLRRPAAGSLRKWLGGLLRNVVRDRRRAARTRAGHEQSAALARWRAEEESHLVREASLHQVVVERLMELREPYRSTLLARYFEGRSPAEIAERTGVSLATVRSRIQRGLTELREDLGRKEDGKPSMLALLALRHWEPLATAPLAAAAPLFSPSVVVVACGLLAVGGLVHLWVSWAPPTRPSSITATTGPEGAQGGSAGVGEVGTAGPATQVAASREALPPPVTSAPPTLVVDVEVVDLQHQPIQGAEVGYQRSHAVGTWSSGPTSVTDATGRARIEVLEGNGTVAARTPGFLPLGFPGVDAASPPGDPLVIVMAPAASALGQIRDTSGAPIQGVMVRIGYLAAFPEPIGRYIDRSNHPDFNVETDAEGRFSVRVPVISVPLGLIARKVGFDDLKLPGLHFGGVVPALELTLAPVADPRTCFGTVVSDVGDPLPGAWIGNGERVARAGVGGRFQLGPVPAGASLWVGAPGFAPRQIEPPEDLRDITLELSGRALSIVGQVARADGASVAGLEVRLVPETPAGVHYFVYGGRNAFTSVSVEAFHRTSVGPVPERPLARVGPDGRFALEGLLPRDYELEVRDPRSLLRVTGVRVPAGAAGVRIEVPSAPPPLDGTVMTPEGEPLSGVLVRTLASGPEFRQGQQVRTDPMGRFHFDSLVSDAHVVADVSLPWVHLTAPVPAQGPLAIVVEPAARLRFSLDSAQYRGTSERLVLQALDAAGQVVPVIVDDIRFYRNSQVPLELEPSGRFTAPPLVVPTRAIQLAVSAAGEPFLRHPVQWNAGALLVVEL